MPGDLPGVDGNEDKEVCECVSVACLWCWVGGWDHHCCGSQRWFTLGGCQVSETSWRIRGSTQNSVCINNNHTSDGLWCCISKESTLSSMLHVKGISQCLYQPPPPSIYSPILPHPFCQTPPFGQAVPRG